MPAERIISSVSTYTSIEAEGNRHRDLTPKYATLTAVGIAAPVRAADAEFLDEHPESSELWSPGSPVFPVVEAQDGYAPSVKHLRDLLEKVGRDS